MKRKFTILIFLWSVGTALLGNSSPFPALFNETFQTFRIMGGVVVDVSDFPQYLAEVSEVEALPSPTATPQPTSTATPQPTSTATLPPTSTATPQPTPTATPQPTSTVQPTSTTTSQPTSTATPQPTPTATPQPTPTATVRPDSGQSSRCADPATLGYEQDGKWVVGECATMTGIAKHVGIEVYDFIAANPQLADPDLLHPGEVLNLP